MCIVVAAVCRMLCKPQSSTISLRTRSTGCPLFFSFRKNFLVEFWKWPGSESNLKWTTVQKTNNYLFTSNFISIATTFSNGGEITHVFTLWQIQSKFYQIGYDSSTCYSTHGCCEQCQSSVYIPCYTTYLSRLIS